MPSDRNVRPTGARAWRRLAISAVKLSIAVLLVASLFYYDVIRLDVLQATFSNIGAAAGAFVALVLAYVISGLRWFFILRALGIPIGMRACAEIFAIGAFANNLILGGTGGDLVRAVYVSRHVHRDRAGGVVSVFVDRAAGLLGMLSLAVLFGFIGLSHVMGSSATRTVFVWLSVMFCIGVIAVALTFVVMKPPFHAWVAEKLGARTIVHRFIVRSFGTVMQLRQKPLTVLFSFLLSMLSTSLVVVAVLFLAANFGAGGLGWIDYGNATIIALLASAIPITPGGVGVAEGAFAFLCLAWEQYPAGLAYGSIFFGQRVIMTTVSLLGSIAFVTYRDTRRDSYSQN